MFEELHLGELMAKFPLMIFYRVEFVEMITQSMERNKMNKSVTTISKPSFPIIMTLNSSGNWGIFIPESLFVVHMDRNKFESSQSHLDPLYIFLN